MVLRKVHHWEIKMLQTSVGGIASLLGGALHHAFYFNAK